MRKLILLSFTLLVVLVLAACGSGNDDSASDDTESKDDSSSSTETTDSDDSSDEDVTVIIGMSASIETLDPANYRHRPTEAVMRNIFDGLVKSDENGETVGLIAESWENPEPTEWIFTIRDDVKFHDGSDLTVDDVVFTFERIVNEGGMDGDTSPRQGLLGTLETIEAIDDSTVKFTFESPWPIFLKMLPHQQIVPQAYLEEVGADEFSKNPIGAGAFKFVEANLDDRIVLEKFEDYYLGAPDIDNLVFDIIPETSSRVAALQAGEVHRIEDLSPTLAEELKNDESIEIKDVNSTRVYMAEMNTQKAPFDDPEVRKAMNYAVDMDNIVDSLFGDYGVRLPGPLLLDSYAHKDDLEFYEYNPEKAKEILEAKGLEGFSLIIDTEEENKEVAEAIASSLRDIGLDANSRVWDLAVLKEMLLDGERDMFVGDWGNSTLDPYDFMNPKLKTDDRGNYSRYSNTRVDELLELGDVELDDAKRTGYYEEAQDIIYDEAPWIFGYTIKEVEAGSVNLKNWAPSPDSMLYMSEATLEQ